MDLATESVVVPPSMVKVTNNNNINNNINNNNNNNSTSCADSVTTATLANNNNQLIMDEELFTPIQRFYDGCNIFITGGTGFLGKSKYFPSATSPRFTPPGSIVSGFLDHDLPCPSPHEKPEIAFLERHEREKKKHTHFATDPLFYFHVHRFIAVLINKLLTSCSSIDTIYLLVRNKKGKDVHSRIEDIFDDPVSISP